MPPPKDTFLTKSIYINPATGINDLSIGSNLQQLRFDELKHIDKILDLTFSGFQLPGSKNEFLLGEGRYGLLVGQLQSFINSKCSDLSKELISNAIRCQEEGVRWALAIVIPEIYRIDEQYHFDLLSTLLNDKNHWVVREAINSLSKTLGIHRSPKIDSILSKIIAIIRSLEESKNPIAAEIKQPFLNFLGNNKSLSDKVIISGRHKM